MAWRRQRRLAQWRADRRRYGKQAYGARQAAKRNQRANASGAIKVKKKKKKKKQQTASGRVTARKQRDIASSAASLHGTARARALAQQASA
jgi:hypothetical protein